MSDDAARCLRQDIYALRYLWPRQSGRSRSGASARRNRRHGNRGVITAAPLQGVRCVPTIPNHTDHISSSSKSTLRSPCALIALAAIASGVPAATRAQYTELPVEVTHLDLELSPDFATGSLSGSAQLTIRNALAAPVTRVPLQLHRLMTFTEARDGGGRVLDVQQDVVRYAENGRLQVTQGSIALPQPLPPGQSTRLSVKWNGYLTPYSETGSLYVRDHIDTAFTIIREDALAFPTVRVPSRAANFARPFPEFEFTLRVTVPKGLVAAAGGRLQEQVQHDGLVTYVYESTTPVTFVYVTIAPYRIIEQSGLRIYYFPANSLGARMVANGAIKALQRMTQWFGPMAGTLNLAVMEIPDGFGSQASLGSGIIQTAAAFHDRMQLGQLYHELSHLWNAPDLDMPSARWNEGLAGFLENVLTRDLDDWQRMDQYVQQYLNSYLPRFAGDSSNLRTPMMDYGRAGKTDLSYSVGYFMFYVLYHTMGDEAFNHAIGGYYQKHHATGGTLEQLVRELKQAAPGRLDSLFDEWVYSTRWYQRLSSGETLLQMAARYRGA